MAASTGGTTVVTSSPTKAAATPAAAPASSVPPAFAPTISLAQALATASQLPQVQAIQQAQAQSDAQAKAQAATISGYMQALAPILARIAPATQQGYQQSAGETAMLGNAFGNQLGATQQANQDQSGHLLALAGAPEGQQSAVNQVTNPNIGGALGWLNGGLPATGLEQAGAAYGAAANALPGAFAGQGLEQIGALNAKQQLADQAFQQKLLGLKAQLPGLVLKNENTIAGQQEKAAVDASTIQYHNAEIQARQAATAIAADRAQTYAKAVQIQQQYHNGELSAREAANQIAALRAQNSAAEANARIAITKANDAARIAQENTRLAIEQANAQTSRLRANASVAPKYSASVSRSLGYRADQYGNPMGSKVKLLPGFAYDKTGNIVKAVSGTSKAATTAKQHGFSALEVQRFKGTAFTLAQNAFSGFTDSKGVVHPAITYENAITEAKKEGLPAWIYLPALNAVYPPGENGRPQGQITVKSSGPFGVQAISPAVAAS